MGHSCRSTARSCVCDYIKLPGAKWATHTLLHLQVLWPPLLHASAPRHTTGSSQSPFRANTWPHLPSIRYSGFQLFHQKALLLSITLTNLPFLDGDRVV